MKGQIHLYIGEGKGKTTAAVGLCMRGLGAGKKVAFFQFMKGVESSEFLAIQKVFDATFVHATRWDKSFIIHRPNEHQMAMAKELYTQLCHTLQDDRYDMVIADEILVAYEMRLLSEEQILDLLLMKGEKCELILTGDTKNEKILEKCDLITCMTKVKHYYDKGVTARKGIEF